MEIKQGKILSLDTESFERFIDTDVYVEIDKDTEYDTQVVISCSFLKQVSLDEVLDTKKDIISLLTESNVCCTEINNFFSIGDEDTICLNITLNLSNIDAVIVKD